MAKKNKTGVEIFTMLSNKEIDDNTYIVIICKDHEYDIYKSIKEIKLDDLLFEEYSFNTIAKEEAHKIERTRDLNNKISSAKKSITQYEEELTNLGGN